MIYDLQKASLLKRFSAYLLDIILLVIVTTGCLALLASVLNLDSYSNDLRSSYTKYETEYDTSFSYTQEEYKALSPEEAKKYNDAYAALIADNDAMYAYNMLVNLTLVTVSLSILLGYLITEFFVPLFLKNGQTVGKKIFGIAVMRTGGIRISPVSLFIRTILGKFTIETMVPVMMILMIFLGTIGIVGPAVILGLLVTQLVLLCVTHTNSVIHDILSDTVTVDLASQMIFNSPEELLAYKTKLAAEKAARQDY